MAKFRCQRNNTFSKLVRSRLRLSSLFPLSPPASGISSLASILIKTATQLSIKPTREREREKLSCPRKASDFPFDSSQSITIYAFKGPPRRLNFEWRFAPLWIDNSSLMLDFFYLVSITRREESICHFRSFGDRPVCCYELVFVRI